MTWKLVPTSFELAKNQAQTLLENETWKWKETTHVRYVLAKLLKFVLRYLFTEDSLKTEKELN